MISVGEICRTEWMPSDSNEVFTALAWVGQQVTGSEPVLIPSATLGFRLEHLTVVYAWLVFFPWSIIMKGRKSTPL